MAVQTKLDLKQIETKLSRATSLPILPGVVHRVMALSDNPNTPIVEFEKVISQDAALAAKILRTANTPFFGGRDITNLSRAVQQLGVNTLRSISLTVGFQASMNMRKLPPNFHVSHFWQHCLAVACAAKIIACLKRHAHPEEAFLAGLMHDIGKLALCMFMPTEANLVFNLMETQQISQHEAEQQLFDLTHQEIGRFTAERWSLPCNLWNPIAQHHTPISEDGTIDPLTAYVHIGNALAYDIDMGFAPRGESNDPDPLVLEFVGIAEAQYDPLRHAVYNEVSRISTLMQM